MKEKECIKGLTPEEKIEYADAQARNYFRSGLNCTECVMRAFMDMYETDLPDDVLCLATGFGGGIGHTKNTCGAITGSILAMGFVKGRKDPFGPKEEMGARIKVLQGEIYPVFGAMVEEVKDTYGTLICSELSAPMGDFDGKARKKNCMEIIAYCSRLASKHAQKYVTE